MNKTILQSQKYTQGIPLDPRTKLVVLFTLSILVFGGFYQTIFFYSPVILPLLISFCVKAYKQSCLYILLILFCLSLQEIVLHQMTGTMNIVLSLFVMFGLYFIPGFFASYFFVTTTAVNEFIAAMEKIKLPKEVTIPMAVMFRFFPTLYEQWHAINEAMKMKNIQFRFNKLGAMIEYRMIPMLMCSIKIGEELSCACLTRGLGGHVKRTNICTLEFKIQDFLIMMICIVFLSIQILIFMGVVS